MNFIHPFIILALCYLDSQVLLSSKFYILALCLLDLNYVFHPGGFYGFWFALAGPQHYGFHPVFYCLSFVLTGPNNVPFIQAFVVLALCCLNPKLML